MIKKVTFILSLAANIALVWFIFSAVRKPVAPQASVPMASLWRKSRVAPTVTTVVTNAVATPFHWSQIESPDYFVFIKNLRSIRCPEATVRDIIRADVEDNFAQRLQEIVRKPVQTFWELIVDEEALEKMLGEKKVELEELGADKENILTRLLGSKYERESLSDSFDRGAARLAFLSPQKREQVLALRERFDPQFQHAYERSATNGPPVAMVLGRVNDSLATALAKVLSPDELEQYELQIAPAAEALRGQLEAFEPTESEFRQLYALRKSLGSRYTNSIYGPSTLPQDIASSVQKNVEDEFSLGLSPGRRADLERSKDEQFRRLYAFTVRLELPRTAAIQLHEIKKEMIKISESIKTDRTLSQTEQQAQLEVVESEHAAAISAVIGASNYNAFKENKL